MSELEIKQMTCEKHGDYTAKVLKVLGREIVMQCPKCKEIEDIKKQKEAEFEAKTLTVPYLPKGFWF